MSGGSSNEGKPAPGEGLRSLKVSGVFRAVNFELYAKPNRYMMTFGGVVFAGCISYLAFMYAMGSRDTNTYTALNDNDEFVVRKKRSKWE